MPELSSSTSSAWDFASNWLTFTPATLFVLLNLVIGTIFLSSRFTPNRKPQQERERERHQPLDRAPSFIDRVKSFNLSFRRNSPPADFYTTSHENTTGVDHPPVVQGTRTPPIVERLKSVKFSSFYRSETEDGEFEPDNGNTTGVDNPPVIQRARAVPLLQRLKSVNLSSFYRSEMVAGEPEPDEDRSDSEEVPEQHHHHVTRSKSEQRVTADRKGAERMKRWASAKAVEVEVDEEVKEEIERVERRRPETARIGKTASFGDEEEGEGVDAKADDFITKFKQQLKLQRLDSLLRYRDMFK
ncbi:pathogen-associated molecular patterns-induced protein A70 [Euphorbia lathyris]|uniref:pathogen-associated molecular patterns-induced protein A70 n=1 Tax=Euphorbia lathyris TaxID=212925 RepID=UPI0033142ACF